MTEEVNCKYNPEVTIGTLLHKGKSAALISGAILSINEEVRFDSFLSYLVKISNLSHIKVFNWPLSLFFEVNGGITKIIYDSNNLNRIMFQTHADVLSGKVKFSSVSAMSSERRLFLKTRLAPFSHGTLSGLKDAVAVYRTRYREKIRDAQQYLSQATEAQNKLDLAEHNANVSVEPLDQLIDDIEHIENLGFWVASNRGSELVFTTASDVIIEHHNERQGVDIKVNLGKFGVKIYQSSERKHAHFFYAGNNLTKLNNYGHPHFSNESEGCRGSFAEPIQKHLSTFNLIPLMAVLKDFVCNYTEGDAFRRIDDFDKEQKRYFSERSLEARLSSEALTPRSTPEHDGQAGQNEETESNTVQQGGHVHEPWLNDTHRIEAMVGARPAIPVDFHVSPYNTADTTAAYYSAAADARARNSRQDSQPEAPDEDLF